MQDVESTKLVHIKLASVIRLLSSTVDCGPRLFSDVPLGFRFLLLLKIAACPVADG